MRRPYSFREWLFKDKQGSTTSLKCGVNPISGQPSYNAQPFNELGNERNDANGKGHFKAKRGSRSHEGIDIKANLNQSPVLAFRSGTVVSINFESGGYGYIVTIDHGAGMTTRYAHLQEGSILVKAGESVKRGQQIAVAGDTGNANNTEPHLHFEVRINGKPRDPSKFINNPCPPRVVER